MKHSEQQSTRAKNKLKLLYDYKDCDFYSENKRWFLNCKDNVGYSAFDVLKELQLTYMDNLSQDKYGLKFDSNDIYV